MNKTKQLKKVKIDEHINKSKKTIPALSSGKKRGRPKKEPIEVGQIPISSGEEPIDHASTSTGDIKPEIIPVYDTTEQAKAFIKTPFEVSAMIFSEPRLTLYPEELDAVMPSWKVVFDKHIVPNLGENADVYLFATVMLGITAKKYSIIANRPKESKIEREMKVEENRPVQNQNLNASIPTMPVFGGNA